MSSSLQPERIGQRYRVQRKLGKGGMASVYEVADLSLGTVVALKQLLPAADEQRTRQAEQLFEREFHTLAELSHPRVIAVYDYGVEEGRPFYTMELLDGGDLRERVPLPWREACSLLYEVCSSLALLHSRRLIHRDVSPRNIRCTRDGAAKLIDFGAMVPMGHGRQAVGTPAFIAPEVLHRATLDARTDLFSLGATLYHALTGLMAYPARDFEHLAEAWANKPPLPSHVAPDVPPALDALVMSLLSLDAASRPRTAFEVMQRLSSITGDDRDEPESVQQAYLSTPTLIGREPLRARLDQAIARAVAGSGSSVALVGAAGVGRSRMLEAYMLDAKTHGTTVLRADADGSRQGTFAIAQELIEQLVDSHPDDVRSSAEAERVSDLLFGPACDASAGLSLVALCDVAAPRAELQAALARLVVSVAMRRPLVIAVDDVQRIDEASAALLVLLAEKARTRKLMICVTSESASAGPELRAGQVLLARCSTLELLPLHRTEEAELLRSVFGDVPNLGFVSDWIHEVAHGNPRVCMDLAQHLVDKQLAVYQAGNWTLPDERAAIDLPGSIDEVWHERIARLSPLARQLAQAHALALDDALTHEHHLQLAAPDHDARSVGQAVNELISQQVLVNSAARYALAHRGLRGSLSHGVSAEQRATHHRALARLYHGEDTPASARAVHHLLAAGEREQGLDRLMVLLGAMRDHQYLTASSNLSSRQVTQLLERALESALALDRNKRSIAQLRHWLVLLSIVTGVDVFYRVAPATRAQIDHDVGIDIYRKLAAIEDKSHRLNTLWTDLNDRYAATPEPERSQSPAEALQSAVFYVAASMAAATNTLDGPLLASLPELLEPFTALSPLIASMHSNAIASYEAMINGDFESASQRWKLGVEQLSEPALQALPHVTTVRGALAYGAGALDARLGSLASATKWAEFLDRDPLQKINALHLRRAIRLQQGDWDGAERLRKQAEVAAVQGDLQMLLNASIVEFTVAALADDLTSLRQVGDRIAKLAAGWPGWVPLDLLAQGHYQRCCGDHEAALAAFDRCLALVPRDQCDATRPFIAWATATGARVEILVALGRFEEARRCGEQALDTWPMASRQASHAIVRGLALAEAKLGDHAGGAARLEALALEQTSAGVSGVNLGATYEARTRVAIWAEDKHAIGVYGALTAEQYRHGHDSALGARYERLMDDARRAGVAGMPDLAQFSSTMMPMTHSAARVPAGVVVERAMRGAETRDERAQYGLALLCERFGARAGYLYLCDKHGLRFAAGHAAGPATPEVLKLVRAELTRVLTDHARATRVLSDDSAIATGVELSWTNASGIVFRPLLLTCSIEGELRYAGVAALALHSAHHQRKDVGAIVAALATSLIRAGDTPGLRDDF